MEILFLGTHNAESNKSRLVSIIIDGIFALDAGCLTSELPFSSQIKLKAVLLSHAHYDHIRSIPCLAFNVGNHNKNQVPKVIGTHFTLQVLQTHLIDGIIYPEFARSDSYLGRPALDLTPIEPYRWTNIENYRIAAFPVNHSIETVAFGIISGNGKSLVYSGDTGTGLARLWEQITPQVLIIDTTFPNRLKEVAQVTGHLCPEMLANELIGFKEKKGYLPDLYLVHRRPDYDDEIEAEARAVATRLGAKITLPYEGQSFLI